MVSAAPIFYIAVTNFVTLALLVIFAIIEIVAFVNCLTQRADAFPVVGSLSKNVWLAILGGSVLVTLVCGLPYANFSIFAFAAITATAIYMLDVRPALRDATNGSGSW
ncbi:MAG TPA: DUF2516 family protein [Micromonosporaceae bacterium]